ncbi:hypothetical protein E2C01_098661 [Portunus trituberculatus]|uniref:Uncharacterized protein n=1 Tax=Portunus trituberculatus TaxID=210409 RepID=A0A5B7K8T8_PORTR|nr:hypothetical protein [Portunus trituberculatus]
MLAQVGGRALSTLTTCGLLWRKDTSRGASRYHYRRQTVRWGATARW